jgi:hypothetical protein
MEQKEAKVVTNDMYPYSAGVKYAIIIGAVAKPTNRRPELATE